ncbi:MAG TPA: hypothetical protein VNI78_03775 [Vicinamibacterales bacterium]|nr:hypothetical protein [Vicinamibacterales bacterium]
MTDPISVPDLLREYGALGILAYVVVWLTRRFNGKIDRLTSAIERLTDKLEHHAQR